MTTIDGCVLHGFAKNCRMYHRFCVDKILQKSWQNLAKLGIISQFERRNYENSSAFRVPRAHKDNDHDGISVQVTKTNLILQVGQSNGFADVTGYAILKYIKTN